MGISKPFHASIHAKPEKATPGEEVDIDGLKVATLAIASNELDTLFAVTFEEVLQRLEGFSRMLCELDGSFVWSGEQEGERWQVDGHLYDRNDRLLYVEIKGRCPVERLDELLSALGWPATGVIFQLIGKAVVIDEAEFRRCLDSTATDSADGR